MGDIESERIDAGFFGVRLIPKNGSISAVLTGDHFRCDERWMARRFCDVKFSECPVYLVRDDVVQIAERAARRILRHKSEDCHAGLRGLPCGTCASCRAKMDSELTFTILGHLERIGCPIEKSLSDAIDSVFGMVSVNIPWSRGMTDEEVESLFERMGVTRKDKNDETHQDG